ncbi:anaphase-promoting complex subunit 1 [Paragonimus westermani]|uniref:Anaphase-promoting complex subunit 1 n=1 Tax=Paragonimus westermani TaxID=34504 RepID=A0A5J4NNL2_9TREM|nr:anaphase-promoting complex subunit 1 [Paragonimus westermani]
MFDGMISIKTLVDWLPTGRFYDAQFNQRTGIAPRGCSKKSQSNLQSRRLSDTWQTRKFDGIHEELYVLDNTVVWTANCEVLDGFPKLVLKTESPVIAACWASFLLPSVFLTEGIVPNPVSEVPGRLQDGIAVFESERLTFVDLEGEQYTARLPCRVAAAWPLSGFMILERQPVHEERLRSRNHVNKKSLSPISDNLFTMFSLSHPLDEAAPVLLKVPLPTGGFGVCFSSDINLQIVTVITDFNLILTRHCSTGVHSLWKVDKAAPEDYVRLYEVGEDGRACVVPRALNQFIHQPPISNNQTVINCSIKPTATPDSASHLSSYLQQLDSPFPSWSAAQTPSRQQKVCLSPFAASLSRMTSAGRLLDRSIKVDSPLVPPGSPVTAFPLTATNLNVHIGRLSSVVPGRPVFSSATPNGSTVSGRRSSVVGCSTKPNCNNLLNSTTHYSHAFAASTNTPTFLRPSTVFNGGITHDTLVSSNDGIPVVNSNRVDGLINEPLLPKVCLRLIWTEPSRSLGFSRPGRRVRCSSVTNREQEQEVADVYTIPPTPTYCASMNEGNCRGISQMKTTSLPASSHFRIAHRRVADLCQPTSSPADSDFTSPLVTQCVSYKQSISSKNVEPSSLKACASHSERHTPAFLAMDLVSVPWICFLSSTSNLTGRTTCLVCVQAHTILDKPSVSASSLNETALTALVSSQQTTTYLPATDAVYVPSSRLIVCVEPGTGIVLYTGVQKVCVLGVSPPAVFGSYSTVANRDLIRQSRQQRLDCPVQTPFVIRPNALELDRWNQNTVPTLLDKIRTSVMNVLTSNCHPSGPQFARQSKHFDSAYAWSSTLGNVSAVPIADKSTPIPIDESCRLLDASGNAFTLSIDNVESTGRPGIEVGDSDRRFLRIYLPKMSENELVQRCLSSLRLSLPPEASLQLLSRWYTTTNAPGAVSASLPSDTATFTSDWFFGSTEWGRFALFMIQSCGLSIVEEEDQPVLMGDEVRCRSSIPDSSLRDIKRQRASSDAFLSSHWEQLTSLFSTRTNFEDPSLFTNSNCSNSLSSYRSESGPPPVQLSTSVRTDQFSRLMLSHLPTVLISFHLVYEEARLNCVMSPQLTHLAKLNLLLSRILNLNAYAVYYTAECPNLGVSELLPFDWKLSSDTVLHWPATMPIDYAPCLLTWLTEELELPTFASLDAPPLRPYLHLAQVNDLAVTLAGMLLSALYASRTITLDKTGEPEETKAMLLAIWHGHIHQLTAPGISVSGPQIQPTHLSTVNNQLRTPLIHERKTIGSPCPCFPFMSSAIELFASAFVQTMLTAQFMETLDYYPGASTQCAPRSHASHNLPLIFLSFVDAHPPHTPSTISNQLKSLPGALSTIVRLLLKRSCADPPPNCSSHVYHLMGREDLARLCELTKVTDLQANSSGFPTCTKSPSESPNNASAESLTELPMNERRLLHASWSLAERWANSVRPLREPPPCSLLQSTADERLGQNSLLIRHSLLCQLENNPSCQAAFRDDLRLREAYRLIQASSHIQLPRLCPTDGVAGVSPSGESTIEQGSRIMEPRLEMHLAAAGVRTWASVVGRGMLGLGTLLGSRVPTQLRVPAICLRGRAVSPTSGRRVLVDLSREAITQPSSTTGAGTATTGVVATGTGRAGIGILDATGGLVGETGAGDRRIPNVNGMIATANELNTTPVVESASASNHPGNALALAVASAVAASGAGAALKTASLDLTRMVPQMNFASQSLAAIATNSASSTASLLSTANLQQTPAVLAAKHWPDFHNGVAVGLTVSPYASIDATWIMYNCRSAAAATSRMEARNVPRPGSGTSPNDVPSPEQAGLLLGLGLNGHLNKLTPYDIGEYMVRVHDLHNMAVLLGLCAGKRGSMDQSVLRLLAVHYRPLLPSDPLVHVQLSVPSLCQAAAVFGLGLLYEGSAHRHITNLLISELGRSLGGNSAHNVGLRGFQSQSDTQMTGNISSTMGTSAGNTWTGTAGSGGLAGDSCELIALSAGLALGLVLLRRGDTPCGLSDLPWAEQLHAYMVGATRPQATQGRASARLNRFNSSFETLEHGHHSLRLASRRLTSTSLNRPTAGVNANTVLDDALTDRLSRTDLSRLSTNTGLTNLHDVLLSDEGLPFDMVSFTGTEYRPDADWLSTPSDSRVRPGIRSGRTVGAVSSELTPGVSGEGSDVTSRPTDRRLRTDMNGFVVQSINPQIREPSCYNTDVSAPGAIMALGMAYLGSGSFTVSSWLVPPTSLGQLELIRPDLLLFRALAHGLVNWHQIVPTTEWMHSYCPATLLDRLQRFHQRRRQQQQQRTHTDTSLFTTRADIFEHPIDSILAELSSEDDVENRCPDLPTSPSQVTSRSHHPHHSRPTAVNGNMPAQPPPPPPPLPSANIGLGTRSATAPTVSRRQRQHGGVRGFSIQSNETDRRGKVARDSFNWQNQYSSDSTSDVDEEAISLAYLNILVGRAFVLGLRYAGTCNPGAANLLFDFASSILHGTWWPPRSEFRKTVAETETPVFLPKPVLDLAVAHCLLSLSMVLAGSGNLAVLRLVRQLRAIRLFRGKGASDPHVRSPTGCTINLRSSFINTPRLNAVAAAAARAAASSQAAAAGASATLTNGPVSVAAVFGAALGPSFGVQMVYASTIGLLFLGGGRLTLSNSPNAAAILCVAFLPILPTYPGDNWYHLQALRHLYVLATQPRRLCAVDVDTGRVVLSDMRAKFQGKQNFISSKDTLVLPSNVLDELAWAGNQLCIRHILANCLSSWNHQLGAVETCVPGYWLYLCKKTRYC